tara:strand:+ start:84 stop:995 length:912 start_codon:yes stop_codon:yes gene_type:complete
MILHEQASKQVHRPKLGSHMSISGGFPKAIERGLETGCEAIQIFTKSSNQWRARTIPETEITEFLDHIGQGSINTILSHASYLINIASPDDALYKKSVAALVDELQRAELLGIKGVVLHPGAFTSSSEKDGILRIIDGLNEVLGNCQKLKTELLLEHTAGQGTVLGYRFEQLRAIIDGLESAASVGICLDTCHLVAAGYDIISESGYQKVFEQFDEIVGLNYLKAFHLNDSKKPLGSRLDRHENIGKGHIGTEPFRRLIQDNRFSKLPMILETPKTEKNSPKLIAADPMDLQNLKILKSFRIS